MTFSRPWELLTGVLLALLESLADLMVISCISNFISILSILFLLYAMIFEDNIMYPSYYVNTCNRDCISYIFCDENNIITKFFKQNLGKNRSYILFIIFVALYYFVFYRHYFITDVVEHKLLLIFYLL